MRSFIFFMFMFALSACVAPEVVETERVVVVVEEDTDPPEVIYVPVPDVEGRVIASLYPPDNYDSEPIPAVETAIGKLEFTFTGTGTETVSRVVVGWLEQEAMVTKGVASSRAEELFGDLSSNPCRAQTPDGFVVGTGELIDGNLVFNDLEIAVASEAIKTIDMICPIVDNRVSEYLVLAPVLTEVELTGDGSVTLAQTNANNGWPGFVFVRPWQNPDCPLFWWGGFAHLAPGQYSTASYPVYTAFGDGISHTAPGGMEALMLGLNGMGCGQGHTLYGFQMNAMRWTQGGDIYLARDDMRYSTWKITDRVGTVLQTVRYPGGGGPFDMFLGTPERVDVYELLEIRVEIDFCDEAAYGTAFCATKTPVSAYTTPQQPTPPPWILEACPYWQDQVTKSGPDSSSLGGGTPRSFIGPDIRCVRIEMSMD